MKVWLDTESGTFSWNAPVAIETEHWGDQDWDTFDNGMSDRERSDYGIMVSEYMAAHPNVAADTLPTPYEWHNDTAVAQ